MPAKSALAVNGRYTVHRVTGVQRYAREIVACLGSAVDLIAPRDAKGTIGHLWEQTVLPATCGGRLLWNPGGTGPALYHRQVVTFHDLFPLEHPEWYSQTYAAWYRILLQHIAKRSLHLIAVSEYTKSRIVSTLGRNPEDITVIHNGLTSGCARVGQDEALAAGRVLNLPSRRYILSLSSIESRKNLRTLLEAWVHVLPVLPKDLWLVLAGPKADDAVYSKQTLPQNVPRVFFAGYVPDDQLAGLYTGASLFIFPSLAEGFGIPVLEAMGCGLRCITSNTSSLPEVGGDVVRYVSPLDAAGLAHAIRDELGASQVPLPFYPAMERAKRFTWQAAASKTLEVLEAASQLQPSMQSIRRPAAV
jgi:glycosyltransferase involved in cell wall biosynthesis